MVRPAKTVSTTGIPTSGSTWWRAAPSTEGSSCWSTCPLCSTARRATRERRDERRRGYSGWLTLANRGEGASEVVVHLSFGERSAEPGMREQAPEGHDPFAEGISATL